MPDLQGKVALVTGAATGIGERFARRLASDGAAVVIADLNDPAPTAQRLSDAGHRAIGVRVDVSDEGDVRAMMEAIEKAFGGLDIAVNNAAMFSSLVPGPFTDITAEQWQRVMAINTLGPFLVAKHAVPLMRKRGGGSIVNVASNTVHKGAPNLLHYVSSKGAVMAFTRALSRELGKDLITVNAIAPGFTLSESVLGNAAYTQAFRNVAQDVRAIQREQKPDDLVGTLSFLVSDDARFMTGQTLVVDGGNVFS